LQIEAESINQIRRKSMSLLKLSFTQAILAIVLLLSVADASASINVNGSQVSVSAATRVEISRVNGQIWIEADCLFGGSGSETLSSISSLTIGGTSQGLEVEISASIAGDVTITGGSGPDHICFKGIRVEGDTTINTFSGMDTVLIEAPVQTSDMIQASTFVGIVDIDTGDGRDEVAIEGWPINFRSWLIIETGRARDIIRLEECICESVLSISAGRGNDRCRLVDIEVQAQTFLSMASDDDLLIVHDSSFDGSAFFNGSSGNDWKMSFRNTFGGVASFNGFQN